MRERKHGKLQHWHGKLVMQDDDLFDRTYQISSVDSFNNREEFITNWFTKREEAERLLDIEKSIRQIREPEID